MFCCGVSGGSIAKETVVLIQYLLCSRHIHLSVKRRNSIDIRHIFKDACGSGLGSGFWKNVMIDFGSFWHPQGSQRWKHGGPTNIEKQIAK